MNDQEDVAERRQFFLHFKQKCLKNQSCQTFSHVNQMLVDTINVYSKRENSSIPV